MTDFLNLNRKPLSRIVDLGYGELPVGMTRDQYVELFLGCKLESLQKSVLLYISFRYNFKKRKETYFGVRRAANDLHITSKTYMKGKKQLEALGWISIKKSIDNEPEKLTLLIGNEIEELEWKEPVAKSKQLDRDDEKRKKTLG